VPCSDFPESAALLPHPRDYAIARSSGIIDARVIRGTNDENDMNKHKQILLAADQGVEPRLIAGSAFDELYSNEVARWAKVVRTAGIKPQ
jgi:hypothetical protein